MYGLHPSNSCSSFEYKFSLTKNNQNGRRLSICFCGQSSLIIYDPITPTITSFHIWITFIKLSVCRITKMAAKMAATYQFQNGSHLSVYTCGHSNLVIYHPISSKFYISNYCSCLNMGFVR